MNAVELNIDQERKEFLLKGETNKINNNRRAKFFFQDALSATFLKDGTIVIPYFHDEERDLTLKKIQNALSKYEIEQSDSQQIKQVLENYYREKENFTTFTEKARKIWKNEVDQDEFRKFTESVKQFLPTRKLYPKQLLAAFHLAFSQNACNFSVPGSGKTSIVYAAYAYLTNLSETDSKHVNKLLIVGPLSSFGPWEDEYKECFGKKVSSKRLSGGVSRDERDDYLLSVEPVDNTPELTLMSYQSLSSSLGGLEHFLSNKGNKVMVVLDEAHKIKNVEGGVWAESALRIANLCRSRVVLTGTPLPNGYEDIYNLFNFIYPNKNIINYNIFQLKEMSKIRFDNRVETLLDNISPYFIRIKKSDLNLPPAISHEPIMINMGPVQREIYDLIENRYIGYFQENLKTIAVSNELSKARFIRLMQAATNPNLLNKPLEKYFHEEGLGDNLYIDDSEIIDKIINYKKLEPIPNKFEIVKVLVEELISKNEKVIIWATFIQNIKELQNYLSKNGISSELLIGEIPVENEQISPEIITREKIIRRFHDNDSPFKVLIANPFAVAESISLHKVCHHAIYLERTFNASNFIQSKDRIHRVGLPDGVTTHYHFILSKDSIDETIHRRLVEKEARMLNLIENQDIPLFVENMDYDIDLENDIKNIIHDYVRRSAKA